MAPSLEPVAIGKMSGSRREREVTVGDVVEFEVVEMLVDRAGIGSGTTSAPKIPLEFPSRFNQPAVTDGYEENRTRLWVELGLTSSDIGEVPGAPAKDRNWLLRIWRLGTRSFRSKKGKQKGNEQAGDSE